MVDQVAITMINAGYTSMPGHWQRCRSASAWRKTCTRPSTTAGLIAEVLPRLLDRDQSEARHSLEDLRRLTRGALAEMRPSVLTDSSLGDLLRQLANAFTGRTNVPVRVKITGEHVLLAETQVALYRICQETLNNIAKHARVSQVEINLQYESEAEVDTTITVAKAGAPQQIAVRSVEMRIRDDGAGFNTGKTSAPGHYGLGMMRERAEAVRAELTVSSQPGSGTEVRLLWPGILKKEAL